MSDHRTAECEIAVLGAAAIDWVARVNELPRRDGIAWAEQYEPYPGGTGGNMAAALARLGKSVRFVGRLGDDEGGQILLRAFQQDGVDTSAVRVERGSRTSACFIAVDAHGEREIYCLGGVALYERPEALAPEWFKGLKALIIADAYPEVALTAIALCGEQTRVVFTPGGLMAGLPAQQLDGLLSNVDVLIASRPEAEKMSACPTPEAAIAQLAARGPATIAVTLGKRGSLLWDGERLHEVPAFDPERIVDTTGAGDAFAAGLVAGMAEGMPWI
ncbi:carbohydrate kinase family protein, partial [bacterium]